MVFVNSKTIKVSFLIVLAVAFAGSCVVITPSSTRSAADGSRDALVSGPVRSETEPGSSPELEVVTEPAGADVYVGYRLFGESPLTINTLDPGRYEVRIEKDGYYPEERRVVLETGTSVRLEIELEPITGFLDIRANVPDITVIIDGESYDSDLIELPIGRYDVTIRRFGYRDVMERVSIMAERQTEIDVTLLPADFAIRSGSLNRRAFNPANPGVLGRTVLDYDVTAPGTGRVSVLDEFGSEVYSETVGPFDTWEQRFAWAGTDASGSPLPAGLYTIELSATGNDGNTDSLSRVVEIDPSLVAYYRGLWSGVPGIGYLPTVDPLPPATFQVSVEGAGVIATNTPADFAFPVRFGIRVGLGANLEAAVIGGVLTAPDPSDNRWGVGGSLLYAPRPPAGAPLAIRFGTALSGYYISPTATGSFAAPDVTSTAPGVAISVPAAITINGITASVTPEYRLAPAPVWYSDGTAPDNEWVHYAYLRGGVYTDTGPLTIGLTGVVRSRLSPPSGLLIRPTHVSADVAYVIPNSPVALSGRIIGEFNGSVTNLYAGLGLGLLF
jgi:hypothetical protein